MNSLSWMIYAADLSSSVATACWLAVTMAVIAIGVHAFGCSMSLDRETAWADFKLFWPKTIKYLLPVLLVAVVLPNKSSIYAIAASEMGEEALHTPTATKAMKALDAWLDRQIADKPKESS